MAEFPGGGVLGPIGAIVGAISSLVGSFVGITAARLFEFLKLLKDYVLKLAQQTLIGMFRTARAVAKVLRALGRLAGEGLKRAFTWVKDEVTKIHDYLAKKFGPALAWLKKLKKHIRDIYDKWVRPVVDAIEFIRQLNAILEVFHITVLKKLDATLATIERRIEEPFIAINKWITWAENQIDRIITLDGLFQRITLLASMAKYAPAWINHFWGRQFDPTLKRGTAYDRDRDYPTHDVLEDVNALTDYVTDGSGDHAGIINELSAMLIAASETTPHAAPEGA